MYKHDDYQVMDIDTAALSQTSPEAMARYQREMAAVFNTIHSQDRLVDLMGIERGVDGTLLSLLCTLLQVSVINTPQRTTHYSYYVQVRGSRKNLPSTYLMDRLNAHESVWGFPYGSLGYPMYFYPTTYMHPSRMVKVCRDHYLRTIHPVGESHPLYYYKEPIAKLLNNLQVMGQELPPVVEWYLGGGQSHTPVGDMEGKAYTTLSAIAKVWLQSGLCVPTEREVLHLVVPPQWRPLYEELVQIRRACEWIPSSSTGTAVERLLLPLMSVHPLSDPQGMRTAMSYLLSVCAPGGWDLLLVVLASEVINKAYGMVCRNPGQPSISIREAADYLQEAYSPTLQRLGVLVRALDDER